MSGSSNKSAIFKFLLGLALVVLLHAAYSVAEWRSLTRRSSQQSSESGGEDAGTVHEQGMPLDITIQTVLAFALAMVCVLQIAGDFKEIRAGIEMGKKTWESARNRPSFYVYNHRGKAFSPFYVPPSDGGAQKKSLMDIPDKFLS